METIIAMFQETTWFTIMGAVVIGANALTMSIPDALAARIPILGKLMPLLNWASLNIFNNLNAPRGFAARKQIEAEIDNIKKS